jgi:GTP diphosphokinase / guanosine-3',5'-bis(diphosphate) 3'-diphosphatase
MITIGKLKGLISKKPKDQKELIVKAYRFAKKSHKNQRLKDTPFIIHPLFVGYLLAKWKQDYEMICAGILHDTIEDAEVSIYTIIRIFGEKVAFFVDGMSWFKTWDIKKQKYSRDRFGYFQKFCKFCLIDERLILMKVADEMSKTRKDPIKTKFSDPTSEKLAKIFWIPFFRKVGLNKVSDFLKSKFANKSKKERRSLYDFISKNDLKKLRSKLNKIKGIEELK